MPASNPASLFGAPGSGSAEDGPCLFEPADGALYPKNWQRPRIYWNVGATGQNVFEVRLHSDVENNDLVVYTTNTYWTLDLATWQTIAWTPPGDGGAAKDGTLVGVPIRVTVRALNSAVGGTPAISNSATIAIAPAVADGSLVYWTTASFALSSTNTTLRGFHIGDDTTTSVLVASQVQQLVRAQSLDGGNLYPDSLNGVFCIGCHTATPDGQYVSFTSQWPWANALASIATGPNAPVVGSAPSWLTAGAASNMSPNINGYYAPPAVNQVMMGIQAFSPAHYATGDRKMIASIGASWNQTEAQLTANAPGSPTGVVSQLAWLDLEWDGAAPSGMAFDPWEPAPSAMNATTLPLATPCTVPADGAVSAFGCANQGTPGGGWGLLARTGDSNSAGGPSWSHNLNGVDSIAYGSTNLGTKDGRMDCELSGTSCTSDVYIVPYNMGAGGTALPLPGASDPAQSEYYPAWSPDDQLIAFNRVPAGVSMYNEAQADVYVIPYSGGKGGTAQALASNTPVACTGALPHTVQNTWPKWAPNPLDPATQKPVPQKDEQGNTYYWVTFSSTRTPQSPADPDNENKRRQQVYVAGVVVGSTGTISSYAPIYAWNQDVTVNNLIPAWVVTVDNSDSESSNAPDASEASSGTSDSGSEASSGGSGAGGGSSSGAFAGAAVMCAPATAAVPTTWTTAGALAFNPSYYLPAATLGMGGYAFAYADTGGSSACLDGNAFCVQGSLVAWNPPAYSDYGAGIGVNLNQAGRSTAPGTFAATGSGITYALSALPPNPVRLIIDNAGQDYCTNISATSGNAPWGSFYVQCYNLPAGDAGASLSAAPATATHVELQISTVVTPSVFDFCITALGFSP